MQLRSRRQAIGCFSGLHVTLVSQMRKDAMGLVAPQVMIFVVSRSSDAVKQALVEADGLKILGDWLLDAANPGMRAARCS